MKFEIFKYQNVTSTNDVAINLISEKKKKSGCVYAETQTKGRGTHGREWISEKGNLFSSLFFSLKSNYPSFTEFTIINPIIISDVIKHFCNGKEVSLKFPNDIFVNKKKICGVLQEIITVDNNKFLIIGIGMNIISSPRIKNIYQTTNILSETESSPNLESLISMIISSYEKFFINLNSYSYLNFKNKAKLMAYN